MKKIALLVLYISFMIFSAASFLLGSVDLLERGSVPTWIRYAVMLPLFGLALFVGAATGKEFQRLFIKKEPE